VVVDLLGATKERLAKRYGTKPMTLTSQSPNIPRSKGPRSSRHLSTRRESQGTVRRVFAMMPLCGLRMFKREASRDERKATHALTWPAQLAHEVGCQQLYGRETNHFCVPDRWAVREQDVGDHCHTAAGVFCMT